MSTDQNLIKAMNLAEEIADKAVRAEQDWPSIEQMAAELATRARQLAASSGQAPPMRH